MTFRRAAALLALLLPVLGCGSTVDALGREKGQPSPAGPDSSTLKPLHGPAQYPNPFVDVLGQTQQAVDDKIEAAFQRLFHGDPNTEAIYVPVAPDGAYIQDVLHDDVRTEGMGICMLAAVELDHREEFDRLWSYVASSLRYDTGPQAGYFRSRCSDRSAAERSVPCADPYGQQQITMALLFAHGRWGSDTGTIDYGAEVLRSLEVMRHKQEQNGGVVDDVTDMFDEQTQIAVDQPNGEQARITRPSNVMPGYYALWAEATGDDTWRDLTRAGRSFLEATAHPSTGLFPLRSSFSGVPEPGSDARFVPEGYRTQLNMTIDQVFAEGDTWYVSEADRLLDFFSAQGLTSYGSRYELDGSRCLDCQRSVALVAVNGVSAMIATQAQRSAFIQAVWDATPLGGSGRYYDGIMHLMALLTLGGRLRVY